MRVIEPEEIIKPISRLFTFPINVTSIVTSALL